MSIKCHYCGKEIDTDSKELHGSYFREFMPEHLEKIGREYYYHEKCLIMVMLQRAVPLIS